MTIISCTKLIFLYETAGNKTSIQMLNLELS